MPTRNPIARAMASKDFPKPKVVKPKKGRGSYVRSNKNDA